MCCGKIVHKSHSRVEEFLLSCRVITACLQLLHSINQAVVLNLFAEGRQSQTYDFVSELH